MYVNCLSFVPGRAAISCLRGICRWEWGWPALTLCPVFAHRCGAECGSTEAVPVWSEDGFSLSAGGREGRLEGERERETAGLTVLMLAGIKETSQLGLEREVTSVFRGKSSHWVTAGKCEDLLPFPVLNSFEYL